MVVPTLANVRAIPLTNKVERAYGGSRGRVAARNAVLVRVETSDGTVGWGESFGAPAVVLPLIEELATSFLGSKIDTAPGFFARTLNLGYHRTMGGPHVAAMSGLDIALTDAFARCLNVSVASLLGGELRKTVVPYASTGYFFDGDDEGEWYRHSVQEAAKEGLRGLKIKLGDGIQSDVERVAFARDTIGDSVALMVDYNANYTVADAWRSLEAIKQYDIYWAEEPLPAEDLGGHAALAMLGIPRATGEALNTRFGFREIISRQLVEYVQPDLCACGGFSEALAIAALARTWNVRVSPHVWGGGISLAAALQFCAALPDYPQTSDNTNHPWIELDRAPNRIRQELLNENLEPVEGLLTVPDGPGLGVTVKESVIDELRTADREDLFVSSRP